jgi:hypothetical protein
MAAVKHKQAAGCGRGGATLVDDLRQISQTPGTPACDDRNIDGTRDRPHEVQVVAFHRSVSIHRRDDQLPGA